MPGSRRNRTWEPNEPAGHDEVTEVEPHVLIQPVCALPGNQTRATRTAAPRTAHSRNRHRNLAPLSLHSNDTNWSVKNCPQFPAVLQTLTKQICSSLQHEWPKTTEKLLSHTANETKLPKMTTQHSHKPEVYTSVLG